MDSWHSPDNLATRPLPGAMIGDFRLLDLIGRGGMAEVWRARWEIGPAPQTVALKRALPEIAANERLRELFLAELSWAVRLNHPHIVRASYAGEAQGEPYLAMELLDGIDLRTLMNHTPHGLPIAFAVSVAIAVAGALAYLRSLTDDQGRPLGLVHLDVSPSNVMICRDGSIKLLDFGIARALGDHTFEVTRHVKGKWGYMAPELIQAGRYDHRVDIYGLGVILYELLANRRLFPGSLRLCREGYAAPLVPPSKFNPAVCSRLDEIVLRALADDPERRYATADELEHDLGEFEANWLPEHTQALLASIQSGRPPPPGQSDTPTHHEKPPQKGNPPAAPAPQGSVAIGLAETAKAPSVIGSLALEPPTSGLSAHEQSRLEWATPTHDPPLDVRSRTDGSRVELGPRASVLAIATLAVVAFILGFILGPAAKSERPSASPAITPRPSQARPPAAAPAAPAIAPRLAVDASTTLTADARPSWLARTTDRVEAARAERTSPPPPPPRRRPSSSNRSITSLEGTSLVSPYGGHNRP